MSNTYLSRYQFLNTVYNHIQYKSQTLQITGFKNTVLFFLPCVKQENQKQCDPYFNSYSALVICSNIIKRSRMIYSLIYSCLHYETVKKKRSTQKPRKVAKVSLISYTISLFKYKNENSRFHSAFCASHT